MSCVAGKAKKVISCLSASTRTLAFKWDEMPSKIRRAETGDSYYENDLSIS